MTTLTWVALDAMGGDVGVEATIKAAVLALKRHDDLGLLLVGDHDQIQAELQKQALTEPLKARFEIVATTEVVAMDEPPALALRNKKDSSMRRALDMVKAQRAKACVSAGNTGALVVTARYVLGMIEGVERAALMYEMPCRYLNGEFGVFRMLDLGANIHCTPEQLFQFGVMGAVVVQAVEHKAAPSVGLLNIGSEEIKGSECIKEASALFQQSDLNYTGFVEGTDIFRGKTDVVVCDGFTGNVALKSAEGVSKLIFGTLKDSYKANWYARLAGLMSWPIFKKMKPHFDPDNHNGANLLGLREVVIKSHGASSAYGISVAITKALKSARESVPQKIDEKLAAWLGEQ